MGGPQKCWDKNRKREINNFIIRNVKRILELYCK